MCVHVWMLMVSGSFISAVPEALQSIFTSEVTCLCNFDIIQIFLNNVLNMEIIKRGFIALWGLAV